MYLQTPLYLNNDPRETNRELTQAGSGTGLRWMVVVLSPSQHCFSDHGHKFDCTSKEVLKVWIIEPKGNKLLGQELQASMCLHPFMEWLEAGNVRALRKEPWGWGLRKVRPRVLLQAASPASVTLGSSALHFQPGPLRPKPEFACACLRHPSNCHSQIDLSKHLAT